jgi:small neutral amino acid transporter SnatA (MarC family)
MTAFERLMGLILSAMAVEMFLAGIREFAKTL